MNDGDLREDSFLWSCHKEMFQNLFFILVFSEQSLGQM